MKNGDIIVCGLWEMDLVRQGLIESGRCKTCQYEDINFDKDNNILYFCSKKGKLEEEQTDCKDWFVSTK